MSHLALTILFSVLLLPAVFLALIPMVPAMSYMFVMALSYGLIDHFVHLRAGGLGVLAFLLLLSLIVDNSAGILGAKYAGASKKSIMAGFVGLILGSVIFPPFGGIPGLFIGVFAYEIILDKAVWQAFRSATGSLAGAVTGAILNFVLAFLMFFLFITFSI